MGLKGYRKVAGLTQAELAAAIGSTQSHVSEYENGAQARDHARRPIPATGGDS